MNLNQGDKHLQKILLKIGSLLVSLLVSLFMDWLAGITEPRTPCSRKRGFWTFHESTLCFSPNLWRPSDWQWPVTGDALVEVRVETYTVAVKEHKKYRNIIEPLVWCGIDMWYAVDCWQIGSKFQLNLLVAMPLQKLSDAAKQIAPKESLGSSFG